MTLKRIIFIAIALPLLLSGCGGGDGGKELPPPDPIGPVNPQPNPNPNPDPGSETVTPLGKNWEAKKIDEGIIYHSFSGADEISGKMQQVFVVDVDLNNPNYKVQLVYTSPREVTSEAFRKNSAIAAMNANYEPGSIYIRVNGDVKSNLPNTTIGDTGVANWKSEAAFSSNRERGIGIHYIGSQKKGEKTVAEQRQWCSNASLTEMPDLITSAPMLIDNYNKLGENFCDYTMSSADVNNLNSEHPDRHQRVRHPRSAVALTESGHFLLFVVDGRSNVSVGMSARELTRFLVKWFNPQYALNMDGGGSSTLCVKGEGDPTTHVVNYPCDNLTDKNHPDHDGQRSRDVHFVILKK